MQMPPELEKFIGPLVASCRDQFPKKCPNCGKEYADFAQFAAETRPLRAPHFMCEGDGLMAISCANCSCGGTFCVKCGDAAAQAELLLAVRAAASSGKADLKTLVSALRDEVRARA